MKQVQRNFDIVVVRNGIIVGEGRNYVVLENDPKPAVLIAELGRANRRTELEAKIEAAATELRNAAPVKIANSDAVALSGYLSGLGVETTADRVNKLLVLLAVLVIECGGGLAAIGIVAAIVVSVKEHQEEVAEVKAKAADTEEVVSDATAQAMVQTPIALLGALMTTGGGAATGLSAGAPTRPQLFAGVTAGHDRCAVLAGQGDHAGGRCGACAAAQRCRRHAELHEALNVLAMKARVRVTPWQRDALAGPLENTAPVHWQPIVGVASELASPSNTKERPMRARFAIAVALLASLAGSVVAQTTKEKEPSLSDDQKKPQQNAADEAAIRGRLEDGEKPGKPSEQTEANKKIEDAAVKAKRKSDAKEK